MATNRKTVAGKKINAAGMKPFGKKSGVKVVKVTKKTKSGY